MSNKKLNQIADRWVAVQVKREIKVRLIVQGWYLDITSGRMYTRQELTALMNAGRNVRIVR